MTHPVCFLLSFRKRTQWEQRRSPAAWARPSWTAKPSACGTTGIDRETAKAARSGEEKKYLILTWQAAAASFARCTSQKDTQLRDLTPCDVTRGTDVSHKSISDFAGECKWRSECVVFWRFVLFVDVCFFRDYSIEVQPTCKVDCKFNPRLLSSVKGQDNNKSLSVWFQCSQSEDLKIYFSVCSSARSDPTAKGRSTWTARATQRWGDPPGGTPTSPPWPSSSAPSPPKPCSCI